MQNLGNKKCENLINTSKILDVLFSQCKNMRAQQYSEQHENLRATGWWQIGREHLQFFFCGRICRHSVLYITRKPWCLLILYDLLFFPSSEADLSDSSPISSTVGLQHNLHHYLKLKIGHYFFFNILSFWLPQATIPLITK